MAQSGTNLSPLVRILSHEMDFWRVISHVEEQNGWTAFHNPRLLCRYDPNHAGMFRDSSGDGERIVQEVKDFYRTRDCTPTAYVDLLTTPVGLEDDLIKGGFTELDGSESDLMLYVGPDNSFLNPEVNIEVVSHHDSEVDWTSIVDEEADPTNIEQLKEICTLQIRDSQVRGYLCRVEGVPAAHCMLFSCNGLGRVESVRTLAQFRRRGLATNLVKLAVQESLAMGNSLTYIYSEPQSDAQGIYHKVGFRVVAHNVLKTFTLNP